MQGQCRTSSIPLWPKLFQGDIWFCREYGDCVGTPHNTTGVAVLRLPVKVIKNILKIWNSGSKKKESGGAFNVIIDGDIKQSNSDVSTYSERYFRRPVRAGGPAGLEDFVGMMTLRAQSCWTLLVAWTDLVIPEHRRCMLPVLHRRYSAAYVHRRTTSRFVYCQEKDARVC
jgi:hypothetical protein